MNVYGFAKYHAQRRVTERNYMPHELDMEREEFLRGVVVDHIAGVVAEDLIERTQEATASDYWSLQ